MRIKTKWYKDKEHSLDEEAGSIAYNLWKIAMKMVLNLENADFQTESNQQRLEIIAETLVFLIHIADRMTIESFDEEARNVFLTELAQKCAKHIHDNYRELYGDGNYKAEFIELLNKRMAEYAEFDYLAEDDGPSFGMKRFFGEYIRARMGERHNKWVADQIIDIEVPQIMKTMNRILINLR